jgi:hypothetical protein
VRPRWLPIGACTLAAATVVIGLVGAQSGPPSSEEPRGEEPIPTDIVERAERRLVQLDVSLKPKRTGKERALELPFLDIADLELVVGGKRVEIAHADRICSTVPATPAPAAAAGEPVAEPAAMPPPVAQRGVYLFYIEHSHLTMAGQDNALTMTAELIPRLVTGGVRGMVVSSGKLWIQSPLSDDPEPLLEMIAEVRKNTAQWTSMDYAATEDLRIREILESLNRGDIAEAKNLIRRYEQEETMLTNNRLRRLAALLGALADLDPPRAVLYFADIVRRSAGNHYTRLVAVDSSVEQLGSDFSADFSFDRVTAQAGALGVRLYTVQAKGFEVDSVGGGDFTAGQRTGSIASVPRVGMRDAKETMESLALETGGSTFYGGTDRKTLDRVLQTIHDDLSCFYLLSFRPEQLPVDAPLPVRVRFNQDSARHAELDGAWEVSSRGQLVVQSEEARRESILLAAHIAEDAEETGRGGIIPLAWSDGGYEGLAQFAVTNPNLPPSLIQGLAWDLGMTHEFESEVQAQVAGRVEVSEPGVPVVIEAVWRFEPGKHRVVSVGHESRYGEVVSSHEDWDWPDPGDAAATITPIAIVQPAHGVFVRKGKGDDEVRRLGSLGVGEDAVLVDRPTYLISLVCRGKRVDRELWIERQLIGSTPVSFEVQHWEAAEGERCVQLRDLVQENQMSWGSYDYEIRVHESAGGQGAPLAQRARTFAAIEPGQTAADLPPQTTTAPSVRDPLTPQPR